MKKLLAVLNQLPLKVKLLSLGVVFSLTFATVTSIGILYINKLSQGAITNFKIATNSNFVKDLVDARALFKIELGKLIANAAVGNEISIDDAEMELEAVDENAYNIFGEAEGLGIVIDEKAYEVGFEKFKEKFEAFVEELESTENKASMLEKSDALLAELDSITAFAIETFEKGNAQGSVIYSVAYKMNQQIKSFGIGLGIVFVLFIVLAIFYLKGNFKIFESLMLSMQDISTEVNEGGEQMYRSSQTVSLNSQSEASAIQETVSTLDEITAMVERTVEKVNESSESSSLTYDAAVQGKNDMNSMANSMNELRSGTNEFFADIDRLNEDLSNIVFLVQDIEQKTKIINDIAFQTKLLSFNASVEAARAGEHGKGFSVVAEEIGSLANLSDDAAKEITEMLQSSNEKIEAMVSGSKDKMESLSEDNKNKMAKTFDELNKCQQSLEEIVKNTEDVKSKNNEILNASQEQSEGVKNIQMAMSDLDNTVVSNSNLANESNENAKTLKDNAENLVRIMKDLKESVLGKEKKSETKKVEASDSQKAKKQQESDIQKAA